MAIQTMGRCARPRIVGRIPGQFSQAQYIARSHKTRHFSHSSPRYSQKGPQYKDSFGSRLRRALGETKIKWAPIPVGLGISFLGLIQLYRINEREKARLREEEDANSAGNGNGDGVEGRPKRRERIRPTGPWSVEIYIFE